jgi:phosphomannomutase/phosphoglucomutase
VSFLSIYKDCDIRGIYGEEFGEKDAWLIGRAAGTMMAGKMLVVGGDVRISTSVLKRSVINGLRESGADIVNIGTVPTPVFYFSLKKLQADGGIMVTASHNPARYNGFKLMLGDVPVTPEIIKEIETIVNSGKFVEGSGSYRMIDVLQDYIERMTARFKHGKLKVVLDCGNGTAGELAPLMFEALGYKVIPLFCEWDGNFPNRDPNPAVYENLTALQKAVATANADFGAAFDGDGDRVVFVDDKGRVVNSERSFVVFIREYLKNARSSVVYDIKSSSVVADAVRQFGGEPVLERSGHTFIKKTFLERHSVLAGEISGHFFFAELGYDDGIYAALKMAEILDQKIEKLSGIVDGIPKTLITPDIRIHCPYERQDSLLARVREAGSVFPISLIDGVRVDFNYGWLLIRKSVTEEGITLRIEARDEDSLKKIKDWITRVLPELSLPAY